MREMVCRGIRFRQCLPKQFPHHVLHPHPLSRRHRRRTRPQGRDLTTPRASNNPKPSISSSSMARTPPAAKASPRKSPSTSCAPEPPSSPPATTSGTNPKSPITSPPNPACSARSTTPMAPPARQRRPRNRQRPRRRDAGPRPHLHPTPLENPFLATETKPCACAPSASAPSSSISTRKPPARKSPWAAMLDGKVSAVLSARNGWWTDS
jgi:hypothetical protein